MSVISSNCNTRTAPPSTMVHAQWMSKDNKFKTFLAIVVKLRIYLGTNDNRPGHIYQICLFVSQTSSKMQNIRKKLKENSGTPCMLCQLLEPITLQHGGSSRTPCYLVRTGDWRREDVWIHHQVPTLHVGRVLFWCLIRIIWWLLEDA